MNEVMRDKNRQKPKKCNNIVALKVFYLWRDFIFTLAVRQPQTLFNEEESRATTLTLCLHMDRNKSRRTLCPPRMQGAIYMVHLMGACSTMPYTPFRSRADSTGTASLGGRKGPASLSYTNLPGQWRKQITNAHNLIEESGSLLPHSINTLYTCRKQTAFNQKTWISVFT